MNSEYSRPAFYLEPRRYKYFLNARSLILQERDLSSGRILCPECVNSLGFVYFSLDPKRLICDSCFESELEEFLSGLDSIRRKRRLTQEFNRTYYAILDPFSLDGLVYSQRRLVVYSDFEIGKRLEERFKDMSSMTVTRG